MSPVTVTSFWSLSVGLLASVGALEGILFAGPLGAVVSMTVGESLGTFETGKSVVSITVGEAVGSGEVGETVGECVVGALVGSGPIHPPCIQSV